MKNRMIPAGYMSKKISDRPEWLKNPDIVDLYSVSPCFSENFAEVADFIHFWKYNGYWLFDSAQIIQEIAEAHSIELLGTQLFYYEMYNLEFHEDSVWRPFEPDALFTTDIEVPYKRDIEGYDVVTFSCGNSPECSPLSCNLLADTIPVNKHCLLSSFDEAYQLLEKGKFKNSEPGPYRIMAVYSV